MPKSHPNRHPTRPKATRTHPGGFQWGRRSRRLPAKPSLSAEKRREKPPSPERAQPPGPYACHAQDFSFQPVIYVLLRATS